MYIYIYIYTYWNFIKGGCSGEGRVGFDSVANSINIIIIIIIIITY